MAPPTPGSRDPAGRAAKRPSSGDARLPSVDPLHPGPCRLLVCALDWGLGHATRTSVLVRRWVDQGVQVTLAGNGRSLAFWTREFPELPVRELPDYAVTYAPGILLLPRLALDLPRLWKVRQAEAALVASWERDFDAVFSDNRFGCFLPGKPSWFLTHQLHLAAPRALEWGEDLGERLMARALRPFTEVLVPDRESGGLSGKLGHPVRPERFPPLRWIGPLSRFQDVARRDSAWSGPWDTLALVSGPEPARSAFESDLTRVLRHRNGRHLLVQGLPHLPLPAAPGERDGVQTAPHLGTHDLAAALLGAKQVVTRGGYSTLMDLEALGKLDASCVLVPTPGQTEQEYLARHLESERGVRWGSEGRIPSL